MSVNLFTRGPSTLSISLGLIGLVGGLVSLAGWALDIPALADWDQSGIAIQPNLAVVVAVAGMATILLALHRYLWSAVLGVLIASIGAATLVEHAVGVDVGIDTLLLFGRTWGQAGTVSLGRTGMPGAVTSSLMGLAFMLAAAGVRYRWTVPVLGLAAAAIAGISLVGYLFEAQMLYMVPRLTTISLQAAAFVLAASVGIVAAIPDREPMRTLLENSGAGMMARRMAPFLFLMPQAIGWMRLEGERLGWYDSPFGSALRTFLELVLFSVLLCWAIRAVGVREQAIRGQSIQFQALLNNAPLGVYLVDQNFRIREVNPVAAPVFGDVSQAIGRDFGEVAHELWPQEYADDVTAIFRQTLKTGQSYTSPERVRPRHEGDDQSEYYEWRVERIPLPDGGYGVVCYFRDITVLVRARLAIAQSEERFRALVTASSDILFGMSPDWSEVRQLQGDKFEPPNDETNFGWLQKYVHPDDQGQVQLAIDEAIRSKSIFQSEHRVWRDDGTVGWTATRAVPILNDAGEIVEWFGTASDQTEGKLAEEGLRESRAALQFTLVSAQVGDWDLDLVHNKLRRSPRYDQCLGYSEPAAEWGIQQFFEHVHPEDREWVEQEFRDALKELKDWHVECRVVWPDESIHWISAHGSIYRTHHGKPTRMLGIVANITERMRTEQALRDADRQKDEFLATLAHELRNPLAPVMNSLEIMKRAGGNAMLIEQGRAMMERHVAQMARLVDDLLDVSHITRSKLELKTERVELASIIHQAVETCRPIADALGHKLDVKLPSEPIYMQADLARLTQVFGNILNNACKYTEPGGRVLLTVARQDKQAVVTVKDTGLGIPPEMLPKVFEMFTQVDRTMERAQGGLGIGLSLVKRLVELHGGTVSADSQGLGHGSSFTVRLPILAEAPAEASNEPRPHYSIAGQRVLI
ncbi:MAG: PAS domain-containing protein, partial [Aureliella sp.]